MRGAALLFAPVLAGALLSACQKESASPATTVVEEATGTAKTFGRFVDTKNNSNQSVPYITITAHNICRDLLATHRSTALGRINFNTTACSSPNFGVPLYPSSTAYCYQQGVWYWLASPTGPTTKKYMKFRLGPLYNDMGTYAPLFSYNTVTGQWTCPGQPVSDPDEVEWVVVSKLPTPC